MTHTVVTIEDYGSGTLMTTVTTFASTEQLQHLLAMGKEEGMRQAMAQIDGVLADTSH